jgi:hypothetical protein
MGFLKICTQVRSGNSFSDGEFLQVTENMEFLKIVGKYSNNSNIQTRRTTF